MSEALIHLNHWTYDPATGRLESESENQLLTGLTARVLDVLIAHAPDPVTLEVFAEQAWKQTHLTEDTLAQRIATLRKALGDDPKAPHFIRTVRGEGYALIAEISSQPDPSETTPALTRPPWELIGMGGAIILMIAVLSLNMVLNPAPSAPAPDVQPQSVTDSLLSRATTLMALQDREGVQRGIRLLEDARLEAPEDPRLMIALAMALSTEATKHGGSRPDEAETLARSALALIPEDAGAWRALGYALDAQGQIDQALDAYGQSLVFDPNDGGALSSTAYLLSVRGRLYEALQMDVQSLQVGHAGLFTELQIAHVLTLLGDTERADAFAVRAQRLNPDHPVVLAGLARLAIARGDLGSAAQLLNTASEREQRDSIAQLQGRIALAQGDELTARTWFDRAGHRGRAERMALEQTSPDDLDRLIGDWPDNHVQAAEIAAAQGEAELALTRLNTAIGLGWRNEAWLDASPFLTSVMQTEAVAPIRAQIQNNIAAQADRLNRDESLTEALDTVLGVQP